MIRAEDLECGHLLENAQRLLRLAKAPVSEVDREKVRRMVDMTGPLTWEAVERGRLGRGGLSVLSRLALEGYLTYDRRVLISPATQFHLGGTSQQGL